MSESLVTLEVEEGVAVLHMRDAAGKNAFSMNFVEALMARLVEIEHTEAKVCIIAGLDEVFCAGGDQAMLLSLADGKVAPYDLKLTRAVLDVPVPTIAAMAGHAVGGGLVFGLACDMVLLGRESRYGCNFMDLGFTPGMGTTRLVQIAVGEYIAAEMMYGGQYFKGRHFEGRGVLNNILPKDQVMKKALQMARRIADKPKFALELLKRSLGASRRQAFEEARVAESFMHEICFARPETNARIKENYHPTSEAKEAKRS